MNSFLSLTDNCIAYWSFSISGVISRRKGFYFNFIPNSIFLALFDIPKNTPPTLFNILGQIHKIGQVYGKGRRMFLIRTGNVNVRVWAERDTPCRRWLSGICPRVLSCHFLVTCSVFVCLCCPHQSGQGRFGRYSQCFYE